MKRKKLGRARPEIIHMSLKKPIGWGARCGSAGIGRGDSMADDLKIVNCKACIEIMVDLAWVKR